MKIQLNGTEKKNNEADYKVLEDYGKLEGKGKWEIRFRRVSWNGGEAKYDIRSWKDDPDNGEIPGKGITLSGEAVEALMNILNS